MDVKDLARKYHVIVGELGQWRPVAESMSRLIDECEAACPHPNWRLLRALPYADVEPLVRWLEPLFHKQPPSKLLKALWFGLFNPIRGGETVADVYVCGSTRFNPKSNNWATSKGGRVWWPNGRYAESGILRDIYRIAHTPAAAPPPPEAIRNSPALAGSNPEWDLADYAEYPLVLGYAAFAMREVLGRIKPALVLGAVVEKKGYAVFEQSQSIGVTVGFDSGDWLCLGEFGPSGFARPAGPGDIVAQPRE